MITKLAASLTPLALHVASAVQDWEAQEVLDEAAWDAADELSPYRKSEPAHPEDCQ